MITNEAIMENIVNIVYAANDKYAQYLCVTLNSLLNYVSDNRKYNIFILETDISDINKNYIEQVGKGKANVSITFINTVEQFNKYGTEKLFCHLYFTKEMYLRIFIPSILSDFDKAIYIDIDTIIMDDISKLYDMDLGDSYLGAAKDFNTIVNYKYYDSVKKYFDEILKFKDVNTYFNSGVLLMNLQKLREISVIEKTYELLDKYKELLYPDQDILNLICEGNYLPISNCWNYVPLINMALIQDEDFLPIMPDWADGVVNRKIVHYISEEKPWDVPERPYSTKWWQEAKKTPVYQELLKEYFTKHPEKL